MPCAGPMGGSTSPPPVSAPQAAFMSALHAIPVMGIVGAHSWSMRCFTYDQTSPPTMVGMGLQEMSRQPEICWHPGAHLSNMFFSAHSQYHDGCARFGPQRAHLMTHIASSRRRDIGEDPQATVAGYIASASCRIFLCCTLL